MDILLLLQVGKLAQSVADNANRLLELLLRNDQRRSKANNVPVGRFRLFLLSVLPHEASQNQYRGSLSTYQQALLLQKETQIPCRVAIRLRLVNNHGIQ